MASNNGLALSNLTPVDAAWFSGGNNRMTLVGYDGGGSQTQLDPFTLSYDGENRVKQVASQSNGSATYEYDGEGRRVRKVVNGTVTTIFVYDGFGALAAEYGGSESGGTQYVTADHLGSTRLVTNTDPHVNQMVVRRYDHLPFGKGLPSGLNGRSTKYSLGAFPAASDGLTVKFTGKERDAESGLDYFGARYYSGAQGRFTSPDEWAGGIVDPFTGQQVGQPGPLPYADITDPQTLNKYAYVRNNPLRYTDPDGHCIEDLCIVEGAVVIAAASATAGFIKWLQTPEGKESTRAFIQGTGLLINSAAEGIGNIFLSDARPGTRGKPDHQQTAEEERQAMGGEREVRIDTRGGAKGSRVADAAKTEGDRVKDVVQVYRPTPKGNIPKREVEAARNIEKATGVKPRMVPVRPYKPPRPPKPKLPKELNQEQ